MKTSILYLIILFTIISCSNKDEQPIIQSVEVLYTMEAKIDDDFYQADYFSGSEVRYFKGHNDTFTDSANCLISYKAGLFNPKAKGPELTVIFNGYFEQIDSTNCTTDEYDTFNTLFSKGKVPFSNGYFTKGIIIEYTNTKKDTITYISDLDKSDDFNFKITGVEFKGCNANKCAVIEGEFDCIVRDKKNPDNEDEIHLKDAKFKLLFQSKHP